MLKATDEEMDKRQINAHVGHILANSNNGGKNGAISGYVNAEELLDTFSPLILNAYHQRGYSVRLVTSRLGMEDIVEPNPLTGKLEQLTQAHFLIEAEDALYLKPGHGYIAKKPDAEHNANLGTTFVSFYGLQMTSQKHSLVIPAKFRDLNFDASSFRITDHNIVVNELTTGRHLEFSFFEYHTALEASLRRAQRLSLSTKVRRRVQGNGI